MLLSVSLSYMIPSYFGKEHWYLESGKLLWRADISTGSTYKNAFPPIDNVWEIGGVNEKWLKLHPTESVIWDIEWRKITLETALGHMHHSTCAFVFLKSDFNEDRKHRAWCCHSLEFVQNKKFLSECYYVLNKILASGEMEIKDILHPSRILTPGV